MKKEMKDLKDDQVKGIINFNVSGEGSDNQILRNQLQQSQMQLQMMQMLSQLFVLPDYIGNA